MAPTFQAFEDFIRNGYAIARDGESVTFVTKDQLFDLAKRGLIPRTSIKPLQILQNLDVIVLDRSQYYFEEIPDDRIEG